jgi:succinyl-diaminopimelate desuccinylase
LWHGAKPGIVAPMSDAMVLDDDLAAAVRERRDDMVDLTRDMIRIPTVNPPGRHYRAVCDLIGQRLERQGFAVTRLRAEGTPGDSDAHPRWNLVARREGRRPGDCVHFNGHIDVVEAGEGWSVDPFAGTVAEDRVWGRGACDMKGGLAAAIVAAEAFVSRRPDHAGAIEISATADEESGGYGGVAWLAERGWFDPARVQHVVIPEPLDPDRICLGHRGVWWGEIETMGEIGHGSMPFLGDCAIRHMSAILAAIEAELMPALAVRVTEAPVVPEGARHATLNLNSIHGGQAEGDTDATGLPSPVVADSCRLVLDRRFLAEEDADEVAAEIARLVERVARDRPGLRYAVRELHRVLPTMTDRAAPVVVTVARAIAATIGREPAYVASPGTYDQKHIDRIGRLRNCIAYGPGILALAHKPDEWVGIDDMVTSATVMARTLDSLLTGEGNA